MPAGETGALARDPAAARLQAGPIFVLAAPQSHAALVGAMLGRNPAALGVPELNLFVSDTLEGLWSEIAERHQVQVHGLLRTVAHLLAGEQSIPAIAMGRRWLTRRMHWPTARVFEEIRARAAPLRLVDKSRIYVRDEDCLERLGRLDDAFFLHLTRHPRGQGAAMLQAEGEWRELTRQMVDPASGEPDPQHLWLKVERRIEAFLARIPRERQLAVRAEDILAEPEKHLAAICRSFHLPAGKRAIAAMLKPERSPFAHPGPFGAQLGDEPAFLQNPRFRRESPVDESVEGELPWRKDGGGFEPEVVARARARGYA